MANWLEQYGKLGVWVVYDHGNEGPYAIAIFVESTKALLFLSRQGYGNAAFWPFDMKLSDALDWWNDVNKPNV